MFAVILYEKIIQFLNNSIFPEHGEISRGGHCVHLLIVVMIAIWGVWWVGYETEPNAPLVLEFVRKKTLHF